MKHRFFHNCILAAAACTLAALLVWFYPQNTLSVLTARSGGAGHSELSISFDGQQRSCSVHSGQELFSALGNRSCIPLPGLRISPAEGDICLYYGGMCAVLTPGGTYLRAIDGASAGYLVLDGGRELYQEARDLLRAEAL